MVERENAEKEQIEGNIKSRAERLIEVLSKGGVSDPDLEVRREFPFENDDTRISLVHADSAVDKAWSFASCYPSM